MFGFMFRLVSRIVGFVVKAVIFVAAMAAVAAGVAYMLFDGQAFKQQLAKRVVDVTGRVLSVDGSAQLNLSLPPSIVLNNVRLKNAPWGTRADMARIKRVEIRLNPLAAISGGDTVAQLRLEGADVLLETNSAGIGNWELGAMSALPGAIGAVGLLNSFGVLGGSSSSPSVVLSDATVAFRDGATGRIQTTTFGSGSAVEFAGTPDIGIPSTGSHVLVASASDNTNPCDGTPRDDKQKQNQPNLAAKPQTR